MKCGVVGVDRQPLYLIALRAELNERSNESPTYLINHILGLVGETVLTIFSNDEVIQVVYKSL